MFVRLNEGMATFLTYHAAGTVVDLPEADARRMIDRGSAVPYKSEPEVTIAVPARENAARRSPRSRRR